MIDVLGHPIRKGDTVLTGYYCSPGMDITAKVDKVTKKAVYVNLKIGTYDYSTRKTEYKTRSIRRQPYQVVVVDKQLAHNKKNFPENLI